jgi:hypothetical protein
MRQWKFIATEFPDHDPRIGLAAGAISLNKHSECSIFVT